MSFTSMELTRRIQIGHGRDDAITREADAARPGRRCGISYHTSTLCTIHSCSCMFRPGRFPDWLHRRRSCTATRPRNRPKSPKRHTESRLVDQQLVLDWLGLTFTLLSRIDDNRFVLNVTYNSVSETVPSLTMTRTMASGLESVLSPPASLSDLTRSQAIQLTAMFATMAVVLPVMLQIYHEYLAFVALGPGGTPTTVRGFVRIKLLGLFALRDPCQVMVMPKHLRGVSGFLANLSDRKGPRPATRGIAPHRQVTQRASHETFVKLASAINMMASSNDTLEKHGTGLFSTSPVARTCGGEICHVHPSDGSMHMTLHVADANLVLDAGWGERHPIARGGWFERFVPGGFMMVYAPRNDAEIRTVLQIVRASTWFVSGGGHGNTASRSDRVDDRPDYDAFQHGIACDAKP
nr:hypothetical protein CFP56_70119 [Quercus suber]